MGKILVAGGLFEEDELADARKCFAAALGAQIISRGHVLLGGCRTKLDAEVAAAAARKAAELKLDTRRVIRSWISKSTKEAAHDCGEITRSRIDDWGQIPKRYVFPEPVQESDVVVIIGGWDGTHYAASWARLANKPIVPVATFGLAAAEIFGDELEIFDRKYAARVTLDDYSILDRILSNHKRDTIRRFAEDVVELAERMITPTEVFVIMSFSERGHLKDAYNTFVRVCASHGYHAFKVDEHIDAKQRIVPSIMHAITRSAFIIGDLSEPKPNVYYELGYAQALGKHVITTAFDGTALPFDIFDVPTLFWDSQDTLERKLKRRIEELSTGSKR